LEWLDLLLQTLDLPVGDDRHPFSVRLLSFDNLLTAPSEQFCPVVMAAKDKEFLANGTPADTVELGLTSMSSGFTIADRFFGHKVRSVYCYNLVVCLFIVLAAICFESCLRCAYVRVLVCFFSNGREVFYPKM
jgi:hypothetical protein